MTEHPRFGDSPSCVPASMRTDHIPIRGIPDVLNPDYSRPQSTERTVGWMILGAASLLAVSFLPACGDRAEAPVPQIQVTEITVQGQPDESFLDALGPIALNG